MDQQHIGITVLGLLDCLACADRNDADLYAGLFGKDWQQIVVEPGILGRGGGCDRDEAVACLGGEVSKAGRDECQRNACGDEKFFHHVSSPIKKAWPSFEVGPLKKASAGPCSSTRPR